MATAIKGVKEIFEETEEAIVGDDGRLKNRKEEKLSEQDAEAREARIPYWDK